MMKFTKVPADAFQKLTLNAGILCKSFSPAAGTVSAILGATTGGIKFATNPTYQDFGEDVDNVQANTAQLKRLIAVDPAFSGTLLTLDPATAKTLAAGADIDGDDATHIIPRSELKMSDFEDLWWVGDYSDVNTGASAGFVAIHLKKALNITGFQLQSGKNNKGQLPFDFHGHYDLTDANQTPPYDIYVKAGTGGSAEPSITLDNHIIRIEGIDSTATLTATTTPAGQTVTWASAATGKATVANGVVTAKGAGNTIITASTTVNGVTYSDTCTVIVTTEV